MWPTLWKYGLWSFQAGDTKLEIAWNMANWPTDSGINLDPTF